MLLPVNKAVKERAKINSPTIKIVDNHWILDSPGLEKIVFIHYKKGFAKTP